VVKYFVYIVVPRLSYDHRVLESTQARIFGGTIGLGACVGGVYIRMPRLLMR